MLFLVVKSRDRCRLIVCHCAPSKSLLAVLYKIRGWLGASRWCATRIPGWPWQQRYWLWDRPVSQREWRWGAAGFAVNQSDQPWWLGARCRMLTRCEEMFSWCVVICGTSYMCGARPTCFMMFCAMRRRLCLVRVHPQLTNVFFLLVLLHWTPDELWRLHNEAEADNLRASSPAISPHRTTSSKTPSPPPPSCVLRWTMWWMSSDSTKWQREWQR